jgi:hypothetical protein
MWTGATHEHADPLGECWCLTEHVWLLTVHGWCARSILGLEGCVKWICSNGNLITLLIRKLNDYMVLALWSR